MKKYLLFAGDQYYPEGGWNDYVGSYDSLFEAKEIGSKSEWHHVVNRDTLEEC